MKILEVNELHKSYDKRKKFWSTETDKTTALNGISFEIKRGEIVALVGESGSGKSTILNIIMGITDYHSGSIKLLGKDIREISRISLRDQIKCVLQNPYESFDLKHTLLYSLHEALKTKNMSDIDEYIALQCSNYDIDKDMLTRYPDEVSGGQLQRISIMRSLMLNPKLIICDEIISALDISLQLRILDLIKKEKRDKNLSCLFITHNISLIKNFADTVIVMKKGQIVESNTAKTIFSSPSNEYTKELIESIPVLPIK